RPPPFPPARHAPRRAGHNWPSSRRLPNRCRRRPATGIVRWRLLARHRHTRCCRPAPIPSGAAWRSWYRWRSWLLAYPNHGDRDRGIRAHLSVDPPVASENGVLVERIGVGSEIAADGRAVYPVVTVV